ncbi:hypothetical protein JTB14_014982 [Gonioctena quinquepunctata]|nr:hypothetical protein JTB14_014982 [Gonioctena quinquepunctata]
MFVSEDGGQVVAIYVDDLLVLGSEMKRVQKENFEVTCFGTPRLLLSIQIPWFENRVTLCQELYILKILDKYKMSDCKPSPTPMDCGAKPQAARAEDEKTDETEYQYLKGSARKTLVYMKTDEVKIFMYTDASYASTIDDRKSQSGFIGFYGKAAVTWTSKKQKSVAVSSTEAEYMASSLASRQAAIHISSNCVMHQRSKHIDVQLHHVRKRILGQDVNIEYISTEENIADMLTKPLGKEKFNHLVIFLSC